MERVQVLERSSFSGLVPFNRFPLRKISPSTEFSNPAIKLRRVDFPQPDSPSMATNSPPKLKINIFKNSL